jgi:hypothetical protein
MTGIAALLVSAPAESYSHVRRQPIPRLFLAAPLSSLWAIPASAPFQPGLTIFRVA